MSAEGIYLDALAKVRTIARDGDRLTLRGPATDLVYAVVVPPEPSALTGTTWRLESLLTGRGPDGAASSVRGGQLVLHDDGTFSGSTGCNAVSGKWEQDGDVLTTSDVASEARGCGDLARQEEHVLEVLNSEMTYTIDGRSLLLQQKDGELGLSFRG